MHGTMLHSHYLLLPPAGSGARRYDRAGREALGEESAICNRSRGPAAAIAAVVALQLFVFASVGLAQSGDPALWTTNGKVYSVVHNGGTIYLGGDFTQVGRTTGSWAAVDASTGAPQPPFAGVVGRVYAVAPDGTGGWYLGGSFTAVRGQLRNNLAHLDASGNLTAWNPDVRGPAVAPVSVFALAVSGTTVYIGGEFFAVGGQGRNRIAAIDAGSGTPTAWSPNATGGIVKAIAVNGGTVYAAGTFTNIGGQPRNHIAALDAASGAATPWNPGADHPVVTLAVNGATVYAGGEFGSIGGQLRSHIAALDAATGAATAWDPNADNTVNALAINGGTVYAGGCFTIVGGQPRNYVAALDGVSGAAATWNPSPDSCVSALTVSGGTVYAGGRFTSIGGQPRNRIAALDANSGVATAWDPNADGEVSALAVNGSTVYSGGSFTSVGWQPRNRIAALDGATGAVTPWNPNADGPVHALAASNGTIYVGGRFTGIGGCDECPALTGLDAASGAITWGSWLEDEDGIPIVNALAVSGGTVYIGGSFYYAGGQPRNYIAALDAASGLATDWNPGASSPVVALAVSASTIYVGANGFGAKGVRALDAANGTTTWSVNTNGNVAALEVSGGTVYIGGDFTSIGAQPRNRIAALDAVSGTPTAWDPGVQGVVDALAVSGGTVYVGGGFGSIGGQPRNNIAAIDVANGAVTAWNPDADDRVLALAVSVGTIYLGGQFQNLGGLIQPGIAAITVDTPTRTLLAQFDAASTADGIELRWSFGDPSRVTSVAVERAESATGPWESIAPELRIEFGATVALDRTADQSGDYYYRLVVQLTDGGQTSFGPVSASRGESLTRSDLALMSSNPTPGGIQVHYAVARAGQVRLEVLDVAGRVAATLAERIQDPGHYEAAWDGAGQGGQLAPGLYFLRLIAPDRVTVRKLAVVR